ncbi:MAG: hypothetical protein EOM73_06965, partial [Bacteroidia bacterium]|nr:hypothetical protein [Bacteroidia bacterium]
MKCKIFISLIVLAMVSGISTVYACTNLIVTKGASADGSVMITYAADSHIRYGAAAFGAGAWATDDYATAIGWNSWADGAESTALGA